MIGTIMEQTIERLSTLTAAKLQDIQITNLMQYISCLAAANGKPGDARYRFEQRYPRAIYADYILGRKAAVAAGTTLAAGWATELAALRPLTDGFLEFVRPMTLLGKLTALRRVPFNTSVASQTGGGTYGWIGQGAPTPVTKPTFATATLSIAKAGGIIVVTKELASLSQPGAEVTMRDEMAKGIAQFLDAQLVDPAVAAVSNVSPASITNGISGIASAGTSADNALTDIKALIAAFIAANPNVESAALLMSPANAVALAVAANVSTLGLAGGTLFGVPVVTSTVCNTNVIMVDLGAILYADDGDLDIDISLNASVMMDSAPTDPPVAATVFVSLFQANLVGIRVIRYVNWKRARTSAVQLITGAAYV